MRISIDQLKAYLVDFRIEIGLEMVNRRTNIRTAGAVLETIFENRPVLFTNTGKNLA